MMRAFGVKRIRAVAVPALLAGVLLLQGFSAPYAREARNAGRVFFTLQPDAASVLDRRLVAGLDPAPRLATPPVAEMAQSSPSAEQIVRDIEALGYRKVTGLMRRGQNYVFQATDPYGDRVRVVMNAHTGEIVGLSRIMPRKK